MKGFILLIIMLSLVCSCSKTKYEKHYYDSGEIKFLIEKNESDQKNGTYTEYYKNGNIKTISTYKNDKKGDTIKGYFESGEQEFVQFKSLDKDSVYKLYKGGEILSKGLVENKKISSWWNFYDKPGKLTHSIDYKFIRDTLINNQLKVYDNRNRIIKDSSYYANIKISDTMVVNRIYPFELEYNSNLSDSSTVFFCYSKKFNKDFSNIDKVKIDTLYSGNHNIKSRIKRTELGISVLRGFFVEKNYEIGNKSNEDSTKVNIITSERVIYIDKSIYVIDSVMSQTGAFEN